MMEKQKSRLGRGISSLLSLSEEEPAKIIDSTESSSATIATPIVPAQEGQMFHVELSRVVANPHQPRRTFDPATLAQLAESLKASGLIQPIVVRPVDNGYELVAGERRFRAAQLAGLRTLPAIIRTVDSLQQAQLALIENIHREDLNPIDRALAYQTLMVQLGLTQDELAQRLSEQRSTIANYLRVLSLTDIARQALVDGKMTMGHAKVIAGIADPSEQAKLTQLIANQQLSVRNLENLLKNRQELPKGTPGKPPGSAHIADLEKRLSRSLEMRVEVRQSKKGGRGRLTIHYGSLDQFDELLARLKVEMDE
jgi:ParB family chromosome partitioning protein